MYSVKIFIFRPILVAQVEGLRYLISQKLDSGINPLPIEIDNSIINKFVNYNDESINDLYEYFNL